MMTPLPPTVHSRENPVAALVRAMRPHQWIKNLTCFAGVIFSGQLLQPEMLVRAGLAFAGFCLIASAVYLFNDYLDRHEDRLNPRTANRPLASGSLPVWLAGTAFVWLMAGAGLVAGALGQTCVVVLAGYAALNVGYSLKLKQTVIADVMCIALGFVLRVLFGVYAVRVLPSPWIILCMFFLALYLGFGKRKGELEDMGPESGGARLVLRQYTAPYLDLAFGMTATLTIVTYTLYTVAAYHDATMVLTVVPMVYCMLRYAHQVVVERRGQSPEALLVRDKMMWVGIAAWLLLCVAILYGGPKLAVFPHS